MILLPKQSSILCDKYNDYYKDNHTGFYFLHDFKVNTPLNRTYDEVKKKYNRRIKRFYNSILTNDKVLLVWWSRDKKISDLIIHQTQKELSSYFGKPIYLLFFENEYGSINIKEKQVSEYIVKITADLLKGLKTTQGDKETTLQVLRRIKRKNINCIRIKTKIKKFLANTLASLIPARTLRQQIRRKISTED